MGQAGPMNGRTMARRCGFVCAFGRTRIYDPKPGRKTADVSFLDMEWKVP